MTNSIGYKEFAEAVPRRTHLRTLIVGLSFTLARQECSKGNQKGMDSCLSMGSTSKEDIGTVNLVMVGIMKFTLDVGVCISHFPRPFCHSGSEIYHIQQITFGIAFRVATKRQTRLDPSPVGGVGVGSIFFAPVAATGVRSTTPPTAFSHVHSPKCPKSSGWDRVFLLLPLSFLYVVLFLCGVWVGGGRVSLGGGGDRCVSSPETHGF